MTRFDAALLLAMLGVATPLRADPPHEKPLPGERIGGEEMDNRVGKRLDTRLPSRLDTRVDRRTVGKPLTAAISKLTSDADNGCAKDASTGPALSCQQPR